MNITNKQLGVYEISSEANEDLPAHCYLERRIVWFLMAHLAAAGFTVDSVWDGEEEVDTKTPAQVMEAVFAVDDVPTIRFSKGEDVGRFGVMIVPGNGEDCVSDWTWTVDAGWNAAMDAFDAYSYK